MAVPFDITAATNTVLLDQQTRRGETSFVATNRTGRSIRGRAILVPPQDEASRNWLTLVGEAERNFTIAATLQYTVQIAVPMDASAGSYVFRLNMTDVANPDDSLVQGPTVTFMVPELPPPPPPKKEWKLPFPWWIIPIVIGVLVVIGVVIYLLTRRQEQILFVSRDINGGISQIAVMNADGSGRKNLTNTAQHNYEPAWSPDGNRIAFFSERDGNREIYVMNADGSGQTRLTNNPEPDNRPVWSPDGSRIAFSSGRDGNGEIYIMNADGSGQVNLSRHPGSDYAAEWSPDGSRIAFYSDRDGNWEIYIMNVDGSGQANLTRSPESAIIPAWSPDGIRITFQSNAEIYVVNADGSGQVNLSRHAASDYGAVWSPDGSRIAFRSNRDGNWEIYVMNADGSGQTRLTNNPASHDLFPVWRP